MKKFMLIFLCLILFPVSVQAQITVSDYWRDAISLLGTAIDTSNLSNNYIMVYSTAEGQWNVAVNSPTGAAGTAYADSANYTGGGWRWGFDKIFSSAMTLIIGLGAPDGAPSEVLTVSNTGLVTIDNAPQSLALTVDGLIESQTNGFKFPDGTTQTTAVVAAAFDANTLDEAYDEGGAGAGRTIVADNGAVAVTGALTVSGVTTSGTFTSTGQLNIDTIVSTGQATLNGLTIASGASDGKVWTSSNAGGVGGWESVSAAAGSFTGSGTKWYFPMFGSDTTLIDSKVLQDSATSFISVWGDTAEYELDVTGDIRATGFTMSKTHRTISDDSLVLMINWNSGSMDGDEIFDASGYGNNAELSDGTIHADGYNSGNCMLFDGTDDYAVGDDTKTLRVKNAVTMTAWVYLIDETGGDPTHMVFHKDEIRMYQARDQQDFYGYVYVGGTGYTPYICDDVDKDTWHFIAVTFDGDTIRTFHNGQHLTLGSGTTESEIVVNGTIGLSTGNDFGIGGTSTGSSLFNGRIDDLRIYARALGDDEIEALYHQRSEALTAVPTMRNVFVSYEDEVGIGTFNPTEKLSVSGNAVVSNNMGVVGKAISNTVGINIDLPNQATSYGAHVDMAVTGDIDNAYGYAAIGNSAEGLSSQHGFYFNSSNSGLAAHSQAFRAQITASGAGTQASGLTAIITSSGSGVHTIKGIDIDLGGTSTLDYAYGAKIDLDMGSTTNKTVYGIWLESSEWALYQRKGNCIFNEQQVADEYFLVQGSANDSLFFIDYADDLIAIGYHGGGRPDTGMVQINGDVFIEGSAYAEGGFWSPDSFPIATINDVTISADIDGNGTGVIELWTKDTHRATMDNDGNMVFYESLTAERLVSEVVTITASADNVNVTECSVLNVDTNLGHVTIGGFTGGTHGQILHIYNSDANNIVIEDDEATGNQDIKTNSAADVTITAEGGATLIYDGTDGVWRMIGAAL